MINVMLKLEEWERLMYLLNNKTDKNNLTTDTKISKEILKEIQHGLL